MPADSPPIEPAIDRRITRARRLVWWIPAIACLGLAVLGLYPGSVFTSCFVPLLYAAVLSTALAIWIKAVIASKTRWWIVLLLAGAVVGMVWAANSYLIVRAAFPIFRPSFEQRALRTRVGQRSDWLRPEWIDIYKIQEVAKDERGGVYFVVSNGLIYLDAVYAGFAYRANSEGSPFGSSGYRLIPIDEDWDIFWVSKPI